MVKAIQQKLSESKTARWSVLALVSFTMMCAYFISDIMSPLKTLLEKEIADGGLGWTSMDFGVFNFSYGWFTVFLFMLIIGGIILGYIWHQIFDGLLRNLDMPSLVTNETLGFWGLVILMCWQQAGYMMIIYIAGFQSVPADLYEAAKIDGANKGQLLTNVTLPMMMPSITICSFLTLTNSFKLFDQNLALTGGAPLDDGVWTTRMMALNIYKTFYGEGKAAKGAGQAVGVIFFLIVVVISLVQLYLTRRKEVQA